jgi:hypothetical protein
MNPLAFLIIRRQGHSFAQCPITNSVLTIENGAPGAASDSPPPLRHRESMSICHGVKK